jgi:hypothetical protein
MKRKLFFILFSILGFSFQSVSQGDLLVTPMRVVFEGNKQQEQLELMNLGKDTATYSISFVQRRMKEDGSNTIITTPDTGQMFADPYLRVFPRTVTLAQYEPQVIMVQCRRKPGMAAGEYRSHLYFRSEKNYKPLGLNNSAADSTQLTVDIRPVFGISIPVIIRSGEVNVSTTLSDIRLENPQDTIQTLKLTINRTGNISVFGDLTAEFVPLHGKPYIIGALNGVGVYTNLNKRNIIIKLKRAQANTYKNGKLKVRYTSPKKERYVVYAEGELELVN